MSTPYRTTAVFDEASLPAALTREHRTKARVWGIIRVLEGTVTYRVLEPPSVHELSPDHPGRVLPDQPHRLEIEAGQKFRLQIEFYDHDPR